MGGGEDSRIPSILSEHINEYVKSPDIRIDIVVRTYDIDPEVAEKQIASWREELRRGWLLRAGFRARRG